MKIIEFLSPNNIYFLYFELLPIPDTSKSSGKHSVAKTNALGPSARMTFAVHHNFSDRVHQFDDVDVLQEDTLLGNRDGCLIRVLLSRSKLCFVSHPKKKWRSRVFSLTSDICRCDVS
ncbi:hypothetical protein TNCT_352941 [Trichonephila clavata]|uniref:Uncharacterized protein n=1 Tax=Trichonephila clavata TaxID=2740835 RepID=A0A8X6KNP7_TRICU|nr:hypothetical protein TNCT_352941 [Trichonephila clavata]